MTVLDERYELGHSIGGGGMAEVVEAYDRKLDRRVAVKLLRSGTGDPRARERFAREAQMAAGFTHPNVVTVHDVGETSGQPYLVMELIDGRTLAEVLAEQGPLPVETALAAADALLAALGAAHERGLVHRDVKPANVLIGRDGRVKLADFGIATAIQGASAGLTATGQVIGTPTYLSPEQVDGREATPRTDLYALGVVLYEMLAGVPPFRADHAVAVALAHRDDPVPPLEAHREDLPAGLASVVGRALEKDPADRFADAGEMRTALSAIRGRDDPSHGDTTLAFALPDATRTLPLTAAPEAAAADAAPRSTRPRSPKRRSGVAAALVALAVLIGAGAALLLSRGDDTAPSQAVRSGPVLPSLKVDVPTLPPTTTTTLPTTLDGLIAFVSANPDGFGERSGDLLEGLLDVRDHPDPRGRRAEHLARDIEEWVADGELDPTIGALAIQILGVSADGLSDGKGSDGKGDD